MGDTKLKDGLDLQAGDINLTDGIKSLQIFRQLSSHSIVRFMSWITHRKCFGDAARSKWFWWTKKQHFYSSTGWLAFYQLLSSLCTNFDVHVCRMQEQVDRLFALKHSALDKFQESGKFSTDFQHGLIRNNSIAHEKTVNSFIRRCCFLNWINSCVIERSCWSNLDIKTGTKTGDGSQSVIREKKT